MTHKRLIANLTFGTLALIVISACGGLIGTPGNDGSTPTVKSRPASSEECLIGGVVITVNDKTTIICDGSNGAIGSTGPAGSPGTAITLIPFCPGTPVYPSVFLEYGMCINGSMWGVYSYANGFLSQLPNGNYQSNAVGSQCNFTITGCSVTW